MYKFDFDPIKCYLDAPEMYRVFGNKISVAK